MSSRKLDVIYDVTYGLKTLHQFLALDLRYSLMQVHE